MKTTIEKVAVKEAPEADEVKQIDNFVTVDKAVEQMSQKLSLQN